MQLTRIVKNQLETDKTFLMTMLENHGSVDANVVLQEESGEVLVTLMMTNFEIQSSIKRAVKEFFGENYKVSGICITCGKRLITFKITSL